MTLARNSGVVSKAGIQRVGPASSKPYVLLVDSRDIVLTFGHRLWSTARSKPWQTRLRYSSKKSLDIPGRRFWSSMLTRLKTRRQVGRRPIRHHPLLHGETKRRSSGKQWPHARLYMRPKDQGESILPKRARSIAAIRRSQACLGFGKAFPGRSVRGTA